MPHNDEARHRHPLYDHGLADVRWVGEAIDTPWLAEVGTAYLGSQPPIRHFVVLLKEGTVEVAAADVEVERATEPPANGWIHRRLCG